MTEPRDDRRAEVDPDIQAIIEANEAGTADLMRAYERAEHYYMTAAQVYRPTVVASSNTTMG